MLKKLTAYTLATCSAILLSSNALSSGLCEKNIITYLVDEIKIQKDEKLKVASLVYLSEISRYSSDVKNSRQSIAEIESLLDIRDDEVKYWTARALGNIGPGAKSAIPKLKSMLIKSDCLKGSVTSASAIRVALTKLGEREPPHAICH